MRIAIIATGFMLFLASNAEAFKLTPIEVSFAPTGSGASQSVVLDNPNATPAAIELTVHRRAMAEDGEDILTADGESFLVIPSQVILMPGESQVVRLQWLGGSRNREEAYRLIAEQLPIDLEEDAPEGGRMRLLVRYIASLYVQPEGTTPEISVQDGRVEKTEDGGTVLAFTVKNRGTAHEALGDLSINTDGPAPLSIGPDQLDGISGSVVLAGSQRSFQVPLPQPHELGPVTVSLDYTAR